MNDLFGAIDFLAAAGENLIRDFVRSHRGVSSART